MTIATVVTRKASKATREAKNEPKVPAPRASMNAMKLRPAAIGCRIMDFVRDDVVETA